ncbi:hypothetical protein, partial [Mesorhizobium sp. M2D.F.Ca.ET.223.01.1.1]|uniref:hypothetical protein n=1 Tax=Mesorhizobium sp. M2D.F.Ca.ET.223.01.1.1 TaxID=2563940 RepID=UPI001FE22676
MRSGNAPGVVGGKRQDAQPGCPSLLLVGVKFPGDLRPLELERRHMDEVAPDQQCFAAARDSKACVTDFVARRRDSLDIRAQALPRVQRFCSIMEAA